MTKPIPEKINARRQSGCLRRLYKYLREEKRKRRGKAKTYPTGCRVVSKARKDLNKQCKEIEENNRIRKTSDLLNKTGVIKRTFHTRMGMIKDRNSKEQREAEEIKKKWQGYRELYKKRSSDPDDNDGDHSP